MDSDKELVVLMVEFFKKALENPTTSISFYSTYEKYENVVTLLFQGEYISIYDIPEPSLYYKLNPKWVKKYDDFCYDLEHYNKINGFLPLAKPVYNEKLKNEYLELEDFYLKKESNYFHKLFYGYAWVEDKYTKYRYFIKYNQLYYEINSSTYGLLYNLAVNVEKQLSIKRMTELINMKNDSYKEFVNEEKKQDNKKQNSESDIELLDSILEKIHKNGINSLTKEEKKFLKKNKK